MTTHDYEAELLAIAERAERRAAAHQAEVRKWIWITVGIVLFFVGLAVTWAGHQASQPEPAGSSYQIVSCADYPTAIGC